MSKEQQNAPQATGRAVRPSHTPWPWVVHREGDELLVMSSSADFERDPASFYICSVYDTGIGEDLPNAELIADAPKLLKTLQFVCDTIADCETIAAVTEHGSREAALAARAHELFDRCSEALKKHFDGERQDT